MSESIAKVVLAYSGGLDTSVILQWLKDTYDCEVVTFTADLGQGEEVEPARQKALDMGVPPELIYIEDLREEFVRDFVFPMFRANTIYEGEYLLGTSIARPLIAKRLVEIARETGADAISHGATGKGNDQVRFELGAYALEPGIKVIAPWREWDLLSREKLMAYAAERNIPIEQTARHEEPVLHGCQLAPHLLRRWSAREPVDRAAERDVALVGQPRGCSERSHLRRSHASPRVTSSPSTACRCRRRRCSPSSTRSAEPTVSVVSTSSRTATSASRAGERTKRLVGRSC